MLAALTLALALQPAAAQDTVLRVPVAPAETLAVHVRGRGRPVVLLPGLLGSAYTFRRVAPELAAAGYRVLVVDPLGTGSASRPRDAGYSLEAQAARIGAALDSLDVRAPLVLAHSVGASMALRLALARPGFVRGIVSVNGGPDERAGTDGLRSAMRWSFLIKLFGARGTLRGKLEDGLKGSSHDPAWVTQEVLRGYSAPYDEDLGRVLDAMSAIADAEERRALAPRLPCVGIPVILLVGTGGAEPAVRPEDVTTLTALPRLRVDSVARAGQYIQEERPEAVVQAVQRLRALVDAPGGVGPQAQPMATSSISKVRSCPANG